MSESQNTAQAETEEDFLLQSLEDLEREHAAGDITDEDFQTLRHEYVVRAADALRGTPATESNEATTTRPGSKLRSAAIAMTVSMFAVGLGLFVAQSAGQRVKGQGLTGTVQSVNADRNNKIQQFLTVGRDNLAKDPIAALKGFDGALALQPDIPEALAYSGWVLRIASRSAQEADAKELVAAGLARIEKAIEADPGYADAHAFRGIILLRDLDRPADAAEEFKRLDSDATPPFINQLVASARKEANDALRSPSSTDG